MSKSMLDRAKEWVEKTKPSAAELLASHNNIVKQVKRGASQAEAAEPTLDYLGELFVELDGDPVDLLALDADEEGPVELLGNHAALSQVDSTDAGLVNYDDPVQTTALSGQEKAAVFAMLRKTLGGQNAIAR